MNSLRKTVLAILFKSDLIYVGRGRYVEKLTPGCLLILFALAFIIGGAIGI